MTEVEQQAPAPTTEAPAKEEVVEEVVGPRVHPAADVVLLGLAQVGVAHEDAAKAARRAAGLPPAKTADQEAAAAVASAARLAADGCDTSEASFISPLCLRDDADAADYDDGADGDTEG